MSVQGLVPPNTFNHRAVRRAGPGTAGAARARCGTGVAGGI